MSSDASVDAFQEEIASLIPNLRAFARTLSRNSDLADDLVQETLIKAWRNRAKFEPGSNMKAWLFTILRNTFLSNRRRAKHQVEDPDGAIVAKVGVPGGQNSHMDLMDFQKALDNLPDEQKEALLLVGAEGFSYEEAAALCGCAIGTVKSRVNRARSKLAEALNISSASDFADTDLLPKPN